MKFKMALAAATAVAVMATAAYAAVTFDANTGTGFVGKGDVQLALGLNNAQMQTTAVSFAVTSVTEATWTCDRDAGPQTQERSRTTTTSGVLSSIARVKNQITGYNLTGYDGSVTTVTEGPAIESCPTGWTPGDLVQDEAGDSVLSVNGVPLQ